MSIQPDCKSCNGRGWLDGVFDNHPCDRCYSDARSTPRMSDKNTPAEGLEVVAWFVSHPLIATYLDDRQLTDEDLADEYTAEPLVRLSDAQQWRDRALAAEGCEAAWQPIETAPKDGTLIWLGKPHSLRVGFWAEGAEYEHKGSVGGGWRDFNEGRDLAFMPTHWMRCPDAPALTPEPDHGARTEGAE